VYDFSSFGIDNALDVSVVFAIDYHSALHPLASSAMKVRTGLTFVERSPTGTVPRFHSERGSSIHFCDNFDLKRPRRRTAMRTGRSLVSSTVWCLLKDGQAIRAFHDSGI
jgi:hypothetical protein